MIAEELFISDPLSFCKLVGSLEEEYKDVPIYAIYLHQFALHNCSDAKLDENTFVYIVDDYLCDLFDELKYNGIKRVVLRLDEDMKICSVEEECFVD